MLVIRKYKICFVCLMCPQVIRASPENTEDPSQQSNDSYDDEQKRGGLTKEEMDALTAARDFMEAGLEKVDPSKKEERLKMKDLLQKFNHALGLIEKFNDPKEAIELIKKYWHELKPLVSEEWGTAKHELVDTVGKICDKLFITSLRCGIALGGITGVITAISILGSYAIAWRFAPNIAPSKP